MARTRFIAWNTLAAIIAVLSSAPTPAKHLPGAEADPLPPGFLLPAPAFPAATPALVLEIMRPPTAVITPEQRAIGGMVFVPPARPPGVTQPAALTITLPSPPAVPRQTAQPSDLIWPGEGDPPTPPEGTPRSGWADASS